MNVEQLKKVLEGFNNETEVRLGGYVEVSLGRYNYKDIPLEEKHINPEVSNNTGKTVIIIDLD